MDTMHRTPHRALSAASLALALAATPAEAQTITRESVTSAGAQAGGASFDSALSGDGRFVAFASYANDLVPNDTNGSVDVFVRDLVSGETTRVSVKTGGGQAHGDSRNPSLSFDGRFVAFDSNAPDLVPGDNNGTRDIFVHDRQTQETTRVSVKSGGGQAFGDCFEPVLSADGGTVCYWSFADDLVPGDAAGFADVYVFDRAGLITTRVSQSGAGVVGNANSHSARMSADGGTVVFATSSTNLIGGVGRAQDILAWTRATNTLSVISVSTLGAPGNASSYIPDVSGDGRFVVFESEATNLIPDDRTPFRDIFLRDRAEGTTIRLSDAPGDDEADGASRRARISADGRFAVFESAATNIVFGDTNNRWDVYLVDLVNGAVQRLSLSSGGMQVNQDCVDPALSAGGGRIAFHSTAADLVPPDTNFVEDVFVVRRPTSATSTFCVGTSATCPCGNVGGLGRGCNNSIPTGGAYLNAVGTPSLTGDTLRLDAAGLPPGTSVIFFQGSNATPPTVLGDGLICLGGGIRRLGGFVAAGSMASVGFGVAGSSPISVSGTIPGPGARWYQAWYRNNAAFCTPALFNVTSGVRVDWLP